MYNVIRQDDWDETINEVIGSTDCYDEAQWMKQTAREGEPDVCFFIREEDDEETNEQRLERELRELQANTKWLEDERERLLGTLDYLQRQVVSMA